MTQEPLVDPSPPDPRSPSPAHSPPRRHPLGTGAAAEPSPHGSTRDPSAPRALVAVRPPDPDTPSADWRAWGTIPLLLASDVLAVAAGVAGTAVAGVHLGLSTPWRDLALFAAILMILLWLGGLHRSRLSPSILDDLPGLLRRCLVAAALTVLVDVAWATATSALVRIQPLFLSGVIATCVAVVAFRAVGYAVVRRLRAHGVGTHRTLIVGAGTVGNQVADVLRTHPEYGLRPVGFLDADPPDVHGRPLPVLGRPDDLPRMLQRGQASTVVVAFSSMKESEMVRLIRVCDRFSCDLFVVPRLFELHQVDTTMDTAWGFPLVRLRRATYRSKAWRLKRVLDVVISSLLLVVTAPVLLMVAAAVRLDGGPGIFFTQERVGVDGHHFHVIKFRSLRPASDDESATAWSIADDARLTRVGRFLRATSLDELPQLYNILRGDMSLVGPRPERPHFVSQFRRLYPSYEARHRVPSGLTGWAQVHGLRGDTSIADRARFDNYYIENWSLWMDVKILLRTVASVLRGTGR